MCSYLQFCTSAECTITLLAGELGQVSLLMLDLHVSCLECFRAVAAHVVALTVQKHVVVHGPLV